MLQQIQRKNQIYVDSENVELYSSKEMSRQSEECCSNIHTFWNLKAFYIYIKVIYWKKSLVYQTITTTHND